MRLPVSESASFQTFVSKRTSLSDGHWAGPAMVVAASSGRSFQFFYTGKGLIFDSSVLTVEHQALIV